MPIATGIDTVMKTENLISFLIAFVILAIILAVTIGVNYGNYIEQKFKIEMAKQGMMEVMEIGNNGFTYQCWRPAYSNPPAKIQFEKQE
jgi:hypothetical protein